MANNPTKPMPTSATVEGSGTTVPLTVKLSILNVPVLRGNAVGSAENRNTSFALPFKAVTPLRSKLDTVPGETDPCRDPNVEKVPPTPVVLYCKRTNACVKVELVKVPELCSQNDIEMEDNEVASSVN